LLELCALRVCLHHLIELLLADTAAGGRGIARRRVSHRVQRCERVERAAGVEIDPRRLECEQVVAPANLGWREDDGELVRASVAFRAGHEARDSERAER